MRITAQPEPAFRAGSSCASILASKVVLLLIINPKNKITIRQATASGNPISGLTKKGGMKLRVFFWIKQEGAVVLSVAHKVGDHVPLTDGSNTVTLGLYAAT